MHDNNKAKGKSVQPGRNTYTSCTNVPIACQFVLIYYSTLNLRVTTLTSLILIPVPFCEVLKLFATKLKFIYELMYSSWDIHHYKHKEF